MSEELAGSGNDPLAGSEDNPLAGSANDPLAGSEWLLDTGDDVEGPVPTISFGDDGRVFGTTGVNRLTGGYTVDGSQITFDRLATTRMAGSAEAMDRERQYVEALTSARSFQVDASALVIEGDGGPLTFRRADVAQPGSGTA
jgi:heat shock protein HslJ